MTHLRQLETQSVRSLCVHSISCACTVYLAKKDRTNMHMHRSLLKFDPFLTILWFFSTILIIYVHGSHCRVSGNDVSVATYTILIMLYAQFVLNNVIPVRPSSVRFISTTY